MIRRWLTTSLDYATFPALVVAPVIAAWVLLERGVHNWLVTPMVVAPLVVMVFALEYLRPERATKPRDLTLFVEACHFVFNFEVGYGIALLASAGVDRALRIVLPSMWPSGMSLPLQLVLALTLYEATSYWQHRYFHEHARLWRFHLLHHAGARLDLFRAGRFHFVDFSTVAFLAYLPLVVFRTPENVITLLAVTVSALGLLHHGNVRCRTPAWLDWLICTPAVHRMHHSRSRGESNANYANTVMIFDVIFGTYARPDPVGPAEVGVEGEQLPDGFWAQLLTPFRARR